MFDFFYLAHRFQRNEVTEKQQIRMFGMMMLLFAFPVTFGLSGFLPPLPTDEQNAIQSLNRLALGMFLVSLPWTAFIAANKKGDNRDTIVRFLLLSFDAHVRYGLIVSIVIILAGALSSAMGGFTSTFTPGQWLSLNNMLVLGYTFVISIHMYFAGKIASGAGKVQAKE